MKDYSGRYIGLFALVLALLFVAGPLLAAAPAQTAEAEGVVVRMAVDPTILPPVGGPDDAAGQGREAPAGQPAAQPSPAPEAGDQDGKAAPAPPVVVDVDAPGRSAVPAPAVGEQAPAAPEEPAKAQAGAPARPAPAPALAPAPGKPAASSGKPGPAGVITAMALRSTPEGFELTLIADRPVGDTSYLNLSDPRRLVVDLRQPWTLKTRNVVRADSGPVRHVVAGEHSDRLRLVIHFRTPPARGIEPEFLRTGNRLVVRVRLP